MSTNLKSNLEYIFIYVIQKCMKLFTILSFLK
ncbi:unnamed protein product [Chironomus riparius]|uniref:Uncharacterized protein n=1 Tax=Chironomus riparius TaxID=315576 RepID=A0A9N9RNT5_9DIPT|nr:unnamed protein product [Chironomus riparius]